MIAASIYAGVRRLFRPSAQKVWVTKLAAEGNSLASDMWRYSPKEVMRGLLLVCKQSESQQAFVLRWRPFPRRVMPPQQ
jgi:hypothetical protein